MPNFLTFGFQILSGIQAGALLGLFHLQPRSFEDMHLLGAPLPQLDFFVAPVGCLQSGLARRFARKNSYLVAFVVPKGEVSGFLLVLGHDYAFRIIYRQFSMY